MVDVAPHDPHARRVSPIMLVAGALLALLGLVNVALAGISATTALIRLSGPTTTVLGVLGLGTVVLGVRVARGSRGALVTALVVFGGLFVVQAFAATGGGAPTPAVVTLAVVVAPLVLALRATRPDA